MMKRSSINTGERYYAIPFNAAANGQATALTALELRSGLVVEADNMRDMWITHLALASTGAFLFNLRSSDDDAFITKYPVHSDTLLLLLGEAGKLPRPIRFQRKATLTIDLRDLSNAANSIYLTFHGFRIDESGNCPPSNSRG